MSEDGVCPQCHNPKEKRTWVLCYTCRVANRNRAIRATWRPGGRMFRRKYNQPPTGAERGTDG